jgi:hypothetical protein
MRRTQWSSTAYCMCRDLRVGSGRYFAGFWVFLAALPLFAGTDAPPPGLSPYDQKRQELIAQFTARQEAANWPEKFRTIGDEMGVPPDVLAAVAFTETRWEQLTWPPGETVSPETGRPHPYGIMSLWDNDVLGHSLADAAALIGSTPDALKADPELNIQGAAALLKKYYDENPLPEGTAPQDIESWQNAIVKYCGIKDPYLSYHHVFNCYLAMSQGYDEYGMHWKPHPVDLAPLRAKVKALCAAYDAAQGTAGTAPSPTEPLAATLHELPAAKPTATMPPPLAASSPTSSVNWTAWMIGGLALGFIALAIRRRRA